MDFMMNGTASAGTTILLAHGAGAAMDTDFMTLMAEGLAARGFRVARFEFAYMAARRTGGPKRPPPKMTLLQEEYRAAINALACDGQLLIGGKSMGGRVASMIADGLGVDGVLCLGYPFHPPGKPDSLRTEHLGGLKTPALICQGTRDPFGTRTEVEGYSLSDAITLHWVEDGDHDLKPRKRMTGIAHADALETTCDAVAGWWGR